MCYNYYDNDCNIYYINYVQFYVMSVGLKVFSVWMCLVGVEICWQCCGGYGYFYVSGLFKIYVDCIFVCIYEGENMVFMF